MNPSSLLLLLFLLLQNEEIPYKASDEFQATIELKFRAKPPTYNRNTYASNGIKVDSVVGAFSPFLTVSVANLKILPDEERIRVVDSQSRTLLNKKTSPLPALHFEYGFLDEIKRKDVANEITVYFLTLKKTKLRRIVMTVTENGDFLVNGKWHGKF